MITGEVLALVTDRGGVVSRQELRAVGQSGDMIRRQVRRGAWEVEGRSALVVPGTKRGLATRSRITAINHPTLIPTGASAVALCQWNPFMRFADDRDTPWMIGPHDRPMRWFGVAHPGAATVDHAGLVVASELDAIVDMMRFLPQKHSTAVAMTAIQQRRASLDQLRTRADALVGYPGIGQVRTALRAVSGGAQSEAERRILAQLQRSGLQGWVANHPIYVMGRRLVIDIAFPRLRIALEIDGWAFHSDPAAFVWDRERQNLLVQAGWMVLRFTWADLADIDSVIAQVLAAVRSRAS